MAYEGPGRYRHYKGGEYEVLGLALHESELWRGVVYKPLTPGSKLDGSPVEFWLRPEEDFNATVTSYVEPGRAGPVQVPRFERIEG